MVEKELKLMQFLRFTGKNVPAATLSSSLQMICFVNFFHLDILECNDPATCGSNSSCTESEGSYSCQCQNGFNGTGYGDCAGETIRNIFFVQGKSRKRVHHFISCVD